MAIRFVFPERVDDAVAFAYSPVVEAVLSLHVLVEPKHHPLQHQWVRRLRTLDPALRAEIRAFKFAYADFFPDFLCPRPDEEFLDFGAELAGLHDLRPEQLAFEFLRPLWDHGGSWPRDASALEDAGVRRHALARAERFGEGGAALAELIFSDPASLARRFCSLLERYWDAAFAAEWARVEPRLADAVEDAGRRLAADGLFALLSEMRPRLLVRPDLRQAWIDVPHEHEVAVSPEQRLVLTPSVYVWPHVRVNCDPPYPIGLVYPARSAVDEAPTRLPPADLLRGLRALGDETRLRALALIAERPRSTQELAPLVGLTEAGLSKHLRHLADAGLVSTRRDGYYVLYSLDPAHVRSLASGIIDFLGR